ncbi:unnamed protein product [Gongylonema pulchrum]|uniref:GRIP domain-containing protein n=1 Tax=Gongylonema pulchrum TaxID=637853 RepID=A0A183EEF7_9BILA|nr:unnamed protein product [Gongylonema pulchrum]
MREEGSTSTVSAREELSEAFDELNLASDENHLPSGEEARAANREPEATGGGLSTTNRELPTSAGEPSASYSGEAPASHREPEAAPEGGAADLDEQVKEALRVKHGLFHDCYTTLLYRNQLRDKSIDELARCLVLKYDDTR